MLHLSSLFIPLCLLVSNVQSQLVDWNRLDRVLKRQGGLDKFAGLLEKYPEIELEMTKFPGLTVVAPNDEAFEKAPWLDLDNATHINHLIRYHVLPGIWNLAALGLGKLVFADTMLSSESWTSFSGGMRVGIVRQAEDDVVFISGADSRSTLVAEDIHYSNGRVQVVDTLFAPPVDLAATCRDSFQELTSFLGALYRTGLYEQVAAAKDVTIFAPRNTAFQKVFEPLSEMPLADLREVLAYHIVPNQVLYSSDLKDQDTFSTMAINMGNGTQHATHAVDLSIVAAGNNRYVDASQILNPDILMTNGVIHMIENVMNPRRPDAKPNPSRAKQLQVFDVDKTSIAATNRATPFNEDLPCTADCPMPTQTQSSSPSQTYRAVPKKAQAPKPSERDGAILGLIGICLWRLL